MDKSNSKELIKKHKLLIIDDEVMVRNFLGEKLEFMNFTVYYAEKALEALEIIQTEDIDLILLDGLLPDMDGFQTANAIRNMEQGRDIPIIMISGIYKRMKYKSQAKDAGIDSFIPKPVNMEELMMELNRLLKLDNKQYSDTPSQ